MRRRKIAEIYNRELSGIDSIELPQEKKYARSSWHLYPIKLKKHADIKRSIFEELRTKGIGAQVNYIPVYLQPHYQRIGYSSVRCPNAEEFYRSEISIPLYPSMNDRQIARVISGLRNILRNKDRKA
jgi:dTDP-4-amino-4,6-dideoxygalactose transaminase